MFAGKPRWGKIARMGNDQKHDDLIEAVLNAASGYAAIVMGLVCFLLFLIVLAAVVRVIVGASAGV